MTPSAATPSTTQDLSHPTTGIGRRRWLVLGLILALLLVTFVGWWALARSAYLRSFSSAYTLELRVAAAEQAAHMMPLSARYKTRAVVMAAWLTGKRQLDAQDWSGAVATLAAAYKLDIGDKELLALFQSAQAYQRIKTNWKAHSQHAHEGPGGSLTPTDVIR